MEKYFYFISGLSELIHRDLSQQGAAIARTSVKWLDPHVHRPHVSTPATHREVTWSRRWSDAKWHPCGCLLQIKTSSSEKSGHEMPPQGLSDGTVTPTGRRKDVQRDITDVRNSKFGEWNLRILIHFKGYCSPFSCLLKSFLESHLLTWFQFNAKMDK